MKKSLIWTILGGLTVIIFLSCQNNTNSPEETLTPKLLFSPDSCEIDIGQEIEIDLRLENMDTSIFAISLRLSYDSTFVLSSDSAGAEVGDFFGDDPIFFARDSNSVIYLSLTEIQEQAEVSGSGSVCTLKFIGRSAGLSALQILADDLYFYNSDGNEIEIADLEIGAATINVK